MESEIREKAASGNFEKVRELLLADTGTFSSHLQIDRYILLFCISTDSKVSQFPGVLFYFKHYNCSVVLYIYCSVKSADTVFADFTL